MRENTLQNNSLFFVSPKHTQKQQELIISSKNALVISRGRKVRLALFFGRRIWKLINISMN